MNQQPYNQQTYNQQSYYQQPATQIPVDPGKSMGTVGLVLGIVSYFILGITCIPGLIVSIIAKKKSKEAGFQNGLATAAIIVNSICLVLITLPVIGTIIYFLVVFIFAGAALGSISYM